MASTSKVLPSLVFFIICVSLANAKSFKIQSRIFKGHDVQNIEQFPFMVSLFDNRCNLHVCGGAIISRRHILSSANCYSYYRKQPTHLSASIGSTKFWGKDGVIKNITGMFVHPDYDRQTFKHDLALMKTLDDIIFTNSIQPIALPIEKFTGVGQKVLMPGFGAGFVSIIF